jgi:hypothetical protein
MEQKLLIIAGKYLREKHNFIKVGATSFSVLFGAGLLWMFGKYGGADFWFFLIALALLSGWIWAHMMWFVVGKGLPKNSADSAAQKTNEGIRE